MLFFGCGGQDTPADVPQSTPTLADAYIKSGDYGSAVAMFELLLEGGAPQFNFQLGLALSLKNNGDIDRAENVLEEMSYLFPNDYRIPMHQAHLEMIKQSGVAIEKRDYILSKKFYDAAVKLYSDNVTQIESDSEMQQLSSLIEQLQYHGWID